MIGYTIRHRVRFAQYALFGIVAFGADLGLLFLFEHMLDVPYSIAVPSAFLIATSVHYLLLRVMVFSDTDRRPTAGYAYFLLIMCSNAVVITLLVASLVEFAALPLYSARVAVGTVFGFLSFFLNSRYNFRIL